MTTPELESMATLIARFRKLAYDSGSKGEKQDNKLADRCYKAIVKELARNKRHNSWRIK